MIADAWERNDLITIKDIYYKSCLNQLIIGGFLFLGIWANIDNILIILGDNYTGAKWVIFFIGLGYLIDMATGTNRQIIVFSKYYRLNLAFILILIVLVISIMHLLIPLWGIIGAAIAISASLLLNNIMRFVFLLLKNKMQPFNWKFLVVISFYSGLFILLSYIPNLPLHIDILTRGGLIFIFTILFYLRFPLSDDIKNPYSIFLNNRL